MTRRRILVILAATLASSAAHAEAILHAAYTAASDSLVVDVAYRGAAPQHRFKVRWEPSTDGATRATTGRLVDLQGFDGAEQDYRERAVVPLATLPLGRTAHATVFVPEVP